MPDINQKTAKYLGIPQNQRQKIDDLLKKTTFIGFTQNAKNNKPGNIIYKGDHIWALIGDKKDERIVFLMTKIGEKDFEMGFLKEYTDHDEYIKFLDDVDLKFANFSKRWHDFLEK